MSFSENKNVMTGTDIVPYGLNFVIIKATNILCQDVHGAWLLVLYEHVDLS